VLFGLPESSVDVIAPDVGGGFGPKIMLFYPDELLVPFAAMQLGRPVKWTEDRQEHFVAVNHERGQVHEVEVGFDNEGRLLALSDDFIHDAGAYTPYGIILPIITAAQIPGPYRVPNYRVRFRDVYTNAVPTSPYRGAGRPHACFVMERTLDAIASHLALDRAEVRRRNFIQPDQFPYSVGVDWQDGNTVIYDSGDYPALLEKALSMLGPRPPGDHVGMGLGVYVEGTGVGPYEGAHVQVLVSGKVVAATGIPNQGQAHATVWAQIIADELGVDVADVEVTSGDTRRFPWGVGTFASRSAVVAGNAMAAAAGKVAYKARQIAADQLEVDPADLELVDGRVRVKGSPDRGMPLAAVAVLANPMRYAFGGGTEAATQFTAKSRPGPPLLEAEEPGLEATGYYSPPGSTWASGCHAAYVRVDPKTFRLEILKYVVVHDCGRLINPLVVQGQIEGGVAQGIGGAFYERLAYDEEGQLHNASFMEFLMPYATEIPPIEIGHIETPSPLNPLGVKGAGEAGVIPVGAVIASAVEEAMGVSITEMPLSPLKLFELSRGLADSHHGGHDVPSRRPLVGVPFPSAHVVGRAPRHRGDEHPTERLSNLVSVGVIEESDPVTADLIAAWDNRLGEDMNQTRQVILIRQPILEVQSGRAKSVPHAFCIDEVARDCVADPNRASGCARVAEHNDLAMALLAPRRGHSHLRVKIPVATHYIVGKCVLGHFAERHRNAEGSAVVRVGPSALGAEREVVGHNCLPA
jgi:CO/xanthine dehydrogenase Mo-binding subunit